MGDWEDMAEMENIEDMEDMEEMESLDDIEDMDVFVQAAKGEEIVAIVDPPRTGLPEKAIRSQ